MSYIPGNGSIVGCPEGNIDDVGSNELEGAILGVKDGVPEGLAEGF